MTKERTYPREWFEVRRWGGITPRLFLRETEKTLVYESWSGKERRTNKVDNYATWYPTREEAETAIRVRDERQSANNAARLKREAAPELYEALASLLTAVEYIDALKGEDIRAKAHAALSKARGE